MWQAYSWINPLIILVVGAQTTAGPSMLNNEYAQLGFLGLLLSILIWYSRNSYKESVKRETAAEAEKLAIIARYETDKLAIITRYEKEKADLTARYEAVLKEHDQRYHEIHIEVMTLLKLKIDGK